MIYKFKIRYMDDAITEKCVVMHITQNDSHMALAKFHQQYGDKRVNRCLRVLVG